MRVQPGLTSVAAALLLCLAWTPISRAEDDAKKLCASAFANAQRLMRAGRLLEAKDKLLLCGGPQCPAVMHADCQQWLSNVEASIATVVFQVSPAAGPPPAEAELSLDGAASGEVDGRAVSMDPGPHDFAVTAKGFRTVTRHLVVSEGEKLRREVVILDPLVAARPADHLKVTAQAAHPAQSREARPGASCITIPIVVAASGAALAGISAAYFGLNARSDDRQLASCSPNCTRDVVDHVKREYLWANLSIGLAAVGATSATVLFLLNRSHQGRTATSLGLAPAPNGQGVFATGTF